MDYQTKKVLKHLNKNDSVKFSVNQLHSTFPDIPKDHLIEIVHNLNSNDYVKFVGNNSIRTTNKGKTYFSQRRSQWISKNIIAVLALIVSIVALIRTF